MAGHGGSRIGAGRPEGGISQTRRLLVGALKRGLALAGRQKFRLEGDEETLAMETAAMVAADMVLAGRGDEVLKLYAVATSRDGEAAGGSEGRRKSALVSALERLPGMVVVPGQSDAGSSPLPSSDKTGEYDPSATDQKSVTHLNGPFFSLQLPLTPGGGGTIDAASQLSDAGYDRADLVAREATGRGAGYPLHPPAHPSAGIHLRAENFEKNSEGAR